ncbi:hypothetical protein CRENBAI_007456 [Crenichthys baileyi]|uniref:Uncharacterized protein n=1 Tax=Crenichthys baileyi TaxID=28760 RepID=A0AAV9SEI5_9TELE
MEKRMDKTHAKVISKSKEPRSYLVEMAKRGAWTRRNRRHLQEVPGTDIPAAQHMAESPVPQQDCRSPATEVAIPSFGKNTIKSAGSQPPSGSSLPPSTPVEKNFNGGAEIKLPLRFRDFLRFKRA